MRTLYCRSILLAALLALLALAALQATPGPAYDFRDASIPRASTP